MNNDIIFCACGCGISRFKLDKFGNERKYISGHNRKGYSKENKNFIVPCLCGCGKMIFQFDKKGRKMNYVLGHANKNKNHNQIWNKNISKSKKGKKRINSRKIFCMDCGLEVLSYSSNRKYCNKCYLIRKEKREKEYHILYRNKHREHINNYLKGRRSTDINYAIAVRLRGLLRKALISYSKEGKKKLSDEYGIDYNKIIEYLLPFPEDISKYHIDHIRPLCSFDLTNDEEVKKAFAPENHRWLLKEENLKKISQDLQMSIRRNKNV